MLIERHSNTFRWIVLLKKLIVNNVIDTFRQRDGALVSGCWCVRCSKSYYQSRLEGVGRYAGWQIGLGCQTSPVISVPWRKGIGKERRKEEADPCWANNQQCLHQSHVNRLLHFAEAYFKDFLQEFSFAYFGWSILCYFQDMLLQQG